MKERLDLVRAWLRKGESDLAAVEMALAAGRALDAACFHAQQAAERYLKAYLIWVGRQFPFTHSLATLLEACAGEDPAFAQLQNIAEPLTPYAVELRYDEEFWPTLETAREAYQAAARIKAFVLVRLPADTKGLQA